MFCGSVTALICAVVLVFAGSRLLFVSGQIPVRPDGTVPEGQPRSMVGCAASGWVRPGPRSPS